MVNQPEHMVVDKEGTKVGVADVAVPNDSNIRRNDKENPRTSRVGESSWKGCGSGRTSVVPVVITALAAMNLKLEGWLQQKR